MPRITLHVEDGCHSAGDEQSEPLRMPRVDVYVHIREPGEKVALFSIDPASVLGHQNLACPAAREDTTSPDDNGAFEKRLGVAQVDELHIYEGDRSCG